MNLKRVAIGGWVQEQYVALLRAGKDAVKAGLGFVRLSSLLFHILKCLLLLFLAAYVTNYSLAGRDDYD